MIQSATTPSSSPLTAASKAAASSPEQTGPLAQAVAKALGADQSMATAGALSMPEGGDLESVEVPAVTQHAGGYGRKSGGGGSGGV